VKFLGILIGLAAVAVGGVIFGLCVWLERRWLR